ncbi:MAG TPA: hypothetical protein VFY42_08425 [Gemmatimonadales bacterium]|nr:hypothetical protein [Gemmatimonadales bacterium]
MTPLKQEIRFSPAPETIEMVQESLHRMGLRVSEAHARSLVDAVLAVEGPRLHAQIRGTFENSLEIIRDTAESALGGLREKRVERSDLLGGGRRPIAPRRPLEDTGPVVSDDEPRPVFKRPRR